MIKWIRLLQNYDSVDSMLINFINIESTESTIWLSPIFRAIPDINLKAINYFTRHLELRLTTMNDDLVNCWSQIVREYLKLEWEFRWKEESRSLLGSS